MRVLVTGAGGFVGTVTVRALIAAGHAVRALDVVPLEDGEGFETQVGDIGEPETLLAAVEGVDAVIHLAGGFWREHLSVAQRMTGSVGATVALYQAATEAGIERIVLLSSAAVVTGHPRSMRIDRATPAAFADVYSLAKWLQEEVARRHAAGGGIARITSPILRPWVVVDADGRCLRDGSPIDAEPDPLAHNGCFGWIDRRDLASACVLALTAPLEGTPVYYLMSNPIGRTLVDVAPAADELGWVPAHDFAADIPDGWRMPAGWPVAA
jgi:nucleoside-diphosphate-sugar epimerase